MMLGVSRGDVAGGTVIINKSEFEMVDYVITDTEPEFRRPDLRNSCYVAGASTYFASSAPVDVLAVMVTRTIVLGTLLTAVSKAYVFPPDKTSFGRFLPFNQHRVPESEAVDHVNL